MDTCRDSHGIHNVTVFNVWSCALCYVYLFPNGDLRFNFNGSNPGLITLDNIRKGDIKIEVRILYESNYYFRSWFVVCLHLQIEIRSRARSISDVASFTTIDEQHQLNRDCYFPHASYASLIFSPFLRLSWQHVLYIMQNWHN